MKFENESVRVPLPKRRENEMFAVIKQRLGGSRMKVSCADGKNRLARIPGRKKRKLKRLGVGDLVIISPWNIQDEKADVLYKYRKNQARFLSRKNILPSEIDIF